MHFTDKRALKSRRSAMTKTVIGCLIFIWVMVGLIYGLTSAVSKIKNCDSFNNILMGAEEPDNKAAYLDTEYEIVSFAYEKDRYTGKYVYCFALDENDYFYVIKAREKTIDKLNEEINANGSARVYGCLHKFSDHEIRDYALETLQEIFPDDGITAADLDDILGGYELKITKMSVLSVFLEDGLTCAILFILTVLGAIFTLSGASNYSKFIAIEHQMPERIAMLENEIHGEGAMWLPELNMYACENYFISFAKGIDYSKYTDLLMVYKTVHRTNGIKTGTGVNVLLKNGKGHQIAYTRAKVSLKTANLDNELSWFAEKARAKNPDIFFGYDLQVLADLQRRVKNGEFKEENNVL